MDFTDLIDWGTAVDLAAVTSLPPLFLTAILHETIRFIIVSITWSNPHSKWDVFKAIRGAFPRAKSEKNLNTVGNGLLLCTSQKTTDFWLIIVKTMNLTLHAQTERVYRDNWQIPWRNEMLRMLKVTSVFAFCLAKESQHFDVLPHPCTKIHSFCQVNSFPISQGTRGT